MTSEAQMFSAGGISVLAYTAYGLHALIYLCLRSVMLRTLVATSIVPVDSHSTA